MFDTEYFQQTWSVMLAGTCRTLVQAPQTLHDTEFNFLKEPVRYYIQYWFCFDSVKRHSTWRQSVE